MNCQRFQDELFEYVDGSLSADELAVAEKHLAECDACRQAVEKEKRLASTLTSRLRQSSEALTMPPEIRRDILAACRQRRSAPTVMESLTGLYKYWVRLAIPVAALLIAGVFMGIHYSRTKSHETISDRPHFLAVTSSAGNSPPPMVSVQMSYHLPRHEFHQEGNLVVDTLVDETVDADGTFQASGEETNSPKLEIKTPL